MKIFILATCVFLVNLNIQLKAQITLAGWEINGVTGYGPSPLAPTISSSNVTVGGLTRGPGVGTAGLAASNAWGGTSWHEGSNFAGAVSNGNYVTFSVTAKSGYSLSLTEISSYNIRRSDTGPTTGQWQYQVGAGSFNNIGGEIIWGNNIAQAGNTKPAINLSTISDLQNVAAGIPITFRIANWGATSDGQGKWYINQFQNGNDFILKGTEQVLPVELTNFTVFTKQDEVALSWETASELNNEYFSIEKSQDGRHFTSIGKIDGQGTSYSLNSYSFIDKAPLPGVTYYRLRQVDFNGQFSLSRSLAISYKGIAASRVYPTQATEEITLELQENNFEYLILLFDQSGQVKKRMVADPGITSLKIPVTDLEAGLYYIKILAPDAEELFKIIKR